MNNDLDSIKCTWKEKESTFTAEIFHVISGLYERQTIRYKGAQPRCISKLFIGGLDAMWRDKLAAYQRSVSHFRGALTRVVVNSFNIQLNAMVPESLGK